MGFVPGNVPIAGAEACKDFVKPYRENSTITHLLFSYARRYPAKVVNLE
ncbi:MAG: hypothetical protein QM727_01485 [Niabella sp.]